MIHHMFCHYHNTHVVKSLKVLKGTTREEQEYMRGNWKQNSATTVVAHLYTFIHIYSLCRKHNVNKLRV